jgi:hypothetical protein
MQKFGKIIEQFSLQEPMSQSRSDLHQSFLTWCKFKLVQISVPDGRREEYFYMSIFEKSFKMNHLTNFNQTWFKLFLHEWNSSLLKWRFKSFSKGDNHKSAKIWVGSFKYSLLMTHCKIKAYIHTKAPWYSVESILFICDSWSPGVMRAHNSVKQFYIHCIWENLWKSFEETTESNKFKFNYKVI